MHRVATTLMILCCGIMPACLGGMATKPPGQGPFLASQMVQVDGAGWFWGLLAGMALGVGLAWLIRHVWLCRARRGQGLWGAGDTSRLQAALALMEDVFSSCYQRAKVVKLSDWIKGKNKK